MLPHVTPTIARDLLRRHGLRAGRRFGQHFLVDPNTVRRIVRTAGISPGETILEIGPGLGSLTVALAEAARRVVAVEVDPRVAEALADVIDGAENVEVVVGDALEVDLGALCGGPARLVANLPYDVATPLLMRILESVAEVTGGLVMVQREVGERWTAAAGDAAYSSTSVRIAYDVIAEVAGDVPATVFLPPPKVASVLVRFTRRASPPVEVDDRGRFLRFVRDAFAHRRKTLRNALVASGRSKEDVERSIAGAGLDDLVRPQLLTIEDLARVYAGLAAS